MLWILKRVTNEVNLKIPLIIGFGFLILYFDNKIVNGSGLIAAIILALKLNNNEDKENESLDEFLEIVDMITKACAIPIFVILSLNLILNNIELFKNSMKMILLSALSTLLIKSTFIILLAIIQRRSKSKLFGRQLFVNCLLLLNCKGDTLQAIMLLIIADRQYPLHFKLYLVSHHILFGIISFITSIIVSNYIGYLEKKKIFKDNTQESDELNIYRQYFKYSAIPKMMRKSHRYCFEFALPPVDEKLLSKNLLKHFNSNNLESESDLESQTIEDRRTVKSNKKIFYSILKASVKKSIEKTDEEFVRRKIMSIFYPIIDYEILDHQCLDNNHQIIDSFLEYKLTEDSRFYYLYNI
ncbi:MAG: hypothetical protein MHMPM18_004894, partial [Marteilia pararefringens]